MHPEITSLTTVTFNSLKAVCAKKGYWFPTEGKNNDLFIFGIRSENADQSDDMFDDLLGAYRVHDGKEELYLWKATTDPGLKALQHPSFAEAQARGTAIVVPGQYRGAYVYGFHGFGQWVHHALIQVGPIKIFRDRNRDTILDMDPNTITEGFYGVNIHASSLWTDTTQIGSYSAGCQVFSRSADYWKFKSLLEDQIKSGLGNRFSYTLFVESDFA